MLRRMAVCVMAAGSALPCTGVKASGADDPGVRLQRAETELARDVVTAADRARYSVEAARAALELERFDVASRHATNALDALQRMPRDWNYGNVVHRAHLVLGHVALSQGDTQRAVRELALAGQTPGSPQLKTFGPNMSLALALLERGQKQPVLEYLSMCGKFWEKQDRLAGWRREIEAGRVPDFGPNLRY
jgi:lipopolysaccharide biosynthesis regulator YciM